MLVSGGYTYPVPHLDSANFQNPLPDTNTSCYATDASIYQSAVCELPSQNIFNRQERRLRAAPYQVPHVPNLGISIPSHEAEESSQAPRLYCPQPSPVYNIGNFSDFGSPCHASCSVPYPSNTVVPRDYNPRCTESYSEVTATGLAANLGSSVFPTSSVRLSPEDDAYTSLDQPTSSVSSNAPFSMPQYAHAGCLAGLPQVNSAGTSDLPTAPQIPSTQGALNPAAGSKSDVEPTPPENYFPTPSELLKQLTKRDNTAQKERRRAKKRKTQLQEAAKNLGYTPTDPDTISSHDKKRLYLDSLEQYVLYLHNQLRLVGAEPVPIERVSSGRGLTSRSIRTLLVHMQDSASKLHVKRQVAEVKYEDLRVQLGEELLPSNASGPNPLRRHSVSELPMLAVQYTFP